MSPDIVLIHVSDMAGINSSGSKYMKTKFDIALTI